ncbi:MAG: hypothetical protein ACLUHE_15665 [Christensenellales bacterium]
MNIGQTRVVARLLEGEFIRYRQISLPEEWQTRVTAVPPAGQRHRPREPDCPREGETNLVCLRHRTAKCWRLRPAC